MIPYLLCPLLINGQNAATGFSVEDRTNEYLEVMLDGRIVCRYMYAYDNSTPDRLHETYKPYLHVFDADGERPITKGFGGHFTHHRGIFIGWNKIQFKGKSYDRWHMTGGEIVHQKFLDTRANSDGAEIVSLTHWHDENQVPMIEEIRTMSISHVSQPFRLRIDFSAQLKALGSDVFLDGDPEHAGVQYRPANEVIPEETTYIFPKEKADPTADLDYPWVGETYTLHEKRYSVVEMNHPNNPKETKFSAYRDYGRFGAFFTHLIEADETLNITYRFLIADGEMPATDVIQRDWENFTGVEQQTSVPKITVVGGASKSNR